MSSSSNSTGGQAGVIGVGLLEGLHAAGLVHGQILGQGLLVVVVNISNGQRLLLRPREVGRVTTGP